jgi:hypothetical protein
MPARPAARYRLYIDEPGDHSYNLLDDPSHRYLALLGVWFRQSDDYVAFSNSLEHFKRGIFEPRPDKPVILHNSDLINRKGSFGLLREAEIRAKFGAGLLEIISRAEFRMICVVIDKLADLLPHPVKQVCLSEKHLAHTPARCSVRKYVGWFRESSKYKNGAGRSRVMPRYTYL